MTLDEKNYRKIVRDFKGRIDLMKKTPKEDSVKLFFEMCDFGLKSYIETEKKRFPNKSIKEIIISMHKFRDKIYGRRKNIWK